MISQALKHGTPQSAATTFRAAISCRHLPYGYYTTATAYTELPNCCMGTPKDLGSCLDYLPETRPSTLPSWNRLSCPGPRPSNFVFVWRRCRPGYGLIPNVAAEAVTLPRVSRPELSGKDMANLRCCRHPSTNNDGYCI